MERTIGVVVQNAFVAIADRQKRGEPAKQRPTLRQVAMRVMTTNQITRAWQRLLDEGCSVRSLARDEVGELTILLLTQPFYAISTACMMRSSPRDPGFYPFRGYYVSLREWSQRTSILSMFAGFIPMAVANGIQDCRPSAVHAPNRDFEDFDISTVQNQFVREFLRWVCYTAAHPFEVIGHRMTFYGAEHGYGSMVQAVRTIIDAEGWKGLFKGYSLTMMQTVAAVMFGEDAVLMLEFFYPFVMLRQRMMIEKGPVQSPLNMANTIFKEQGWRGFLAGAWSSLWCAPWLAAIYGVTEGVLRLTFGFKTHNSSRTVPQRTRTALRRWVYGETVAQRKARRAAAGKASGRTDKPSK